jgi:DNA-binding NarL/FixJ family response regulator
LIADDHAILREGLAGLLTEQPDIEIVGEAVDGDDTLAKVRELKPDVLLLDLLMPKLDGLEVLAQIGDSLPETKVIVLTGADDEEYLGRSIQAGVKGYLIKDVASGQLIDAIRAVANGEGWLPPRLAGALFRKLSGGDSEDEKRLHSLTHRELEVLGLIGQARSNAAIASELFISEHTVKTHVSRILEKLGLTARAEAVRFAIKMGLARP